MVLLIFGALCVVAILMLVAILQHEKYALSVPLLFKRKHLSDEPLQSVLVQP